MICIRLDKDINIPVLLQKLQTEINEHRINNKLEDSILYIDIRNISYDCNELILKLENTLEKSDDRGNEVSKSA